MWNNIRFTGVNNCAEGEDDDNGGGSWGGDWDYRHREVDHFVAQICNAEHDSSIELEWADLYDWRTDSEVEYSVISS